MSDATRENFAHKLRYTPMRDLLRGRVTGRLDLNDRLSISDLPESIRSLIRRVIRKTRLWSLEKMDVANELIAHFADGSESGATAEKLVESFGNEKIAAKLIRRAKRRNRPVAWHIYNAFFRAVFTLILIYLGAAIYFFIGRPSPSIDYIAVLNQPIEKVPRDQRAWPLYRQSMIAMGFKADEENSLFDLLDASPQSAQWTNLLQWVNLHQPGIKLVREASEKPALGFVLGPHGSIEEDNDSPRGNADLSPWAGSLRSVLIPHVNNMRLLAEVLNADAEVACQRGDSGAVVGDITALIHMADQLQGSNFLVTDLVSVGIREVAVSELEATLVHSPAMLAEADLQQLAHRLAKPNSDSELLSFQGERLMFNDMLQRMYTDDGSGGGRFTPAGIELLRSLTPMPTLQSPEKIFTDALAPIIMLTTSRKDLQHTYDEIIDSAESNLHQPMRDANWSGYQQHLDQMRNSRRIPYLIAAVLAPSLERSQWTAERYLGHRDGVLIGIALEIYRRQHGAYPKSLDELTPLLLPRVPVDRITGEPVRYRVVDGQPIVYSVGVDRKDDGRRAPVSKYHDPNDAAIWNLAKDEHIPDGDWILYPQHTSQDNQDNLGLTGG